MPDIIVIGPRRAIWGDTTVGGLSTQQPGETIEEKQRRHTLLLCLLHKVGSSGYPDANLGLSLIRLGPLLQAIAGLAKRTGSLAKPSS